MQDTNARPRPADRRAPRAALYATFPGMQIRWTVRAGDGDTVAAVVLRAGGDARAVEDGRVFVGRRRARAGDDKVRVGDELTVAAPAASAPLDVTILTKRTDVVVADKPAGMPTIADHAGATHTLVAAVARALGIDASKLHPTSRLDRDVSGAVAFALSPGARERLERAREEHKYVRRYVAIATRAPEPPSGVWDAPIGRAGDPRHRAANGKDAKPARTHFAVVATATSGAALLALAPVTGRTHQLRVHAAHAGAPLLGDRVYGGPARLTLPTGRVLSLDRIALHAARITLPSLVATSPIPAALQEIWLSLGGDASAWDTAVAWQLEKN